MTKTKARAKGRAAPIVKAPPVPEVIAPKPSFFKRLGSLISGFQEVLEARKAAREQFKILQPWPGVVPAKKAKEIKIAMDDAFGAMASFAFAGGGWDAAGFFGYAYLAELAQITEYRRPAEILANEMTRKWGKLVSTSEDPDVKVKLKELEEDLKKFKVQEVFNKVFELDNFFGIGHIYIDVGTQGEELKSPLLLIPEKIEKGKLVGFRTVEPMWTYPNLYNANDPLKAAFYDPQSWFVMGTEVDKSRLLRFVSRPIPDMLKPAYLFGGVSLTQLMSPYVNNWLQTRQSVSSIISNYSTPVLKTDMDQMTTAQGAQQLMLRGQVYNLGRDNQGLMICDKEKEDFSIVSASLSSLDVLQAQAIEQQAFPAGIPLVKLLGVTPSGLNASSDGEVRVFYDSIASIQERIGTPNLKKVIDILQLNRYGVIDPGITWEWAQLWELDEEKKAIVRKTEAETDGLYVEMGVIDQAAVLNRLSSDPESLYAGLDLGEVPDFGLGGDPEAENELLGGEGASEIAKAGEERREGGPEARPASPAREARPAGTRPATPISSLFEGGQRDDQREGERR